MSPLREEVPNRRQRPTNTRIVRNLVVLHGNVEVNANENTLASHVEVSDAAFVHEPPFGRRLSEFSIHLSAFSGIGATVSRQTDVAKGRFSAARRGRATYAQP